MMTISASPKKEKPPFLRGLFWKITFAIVALVLSVWFITLLLVGLVDYSELRKSLTDRTRFIEAQQAADEAIEFVEPAGRNAAALRFWLQSYREKMVASNRAKARDLYYYYEPHGKTANEAIYLCVTDGNGNLIAANRDLNAGEPPPFTAAEAVLFERAATKGEIKAEDFTLQAEDGTVSLAIPFRENSGGHLVGVWLLREKPLLTWTEVLGKMVFGFLKDTREGLWYLIVFAVIFSFPLTRYLSRRLKHIAVTAQSWSQGDFTAKINDRSADELGILGRSLNEMARELGNVFTLRQELAALEERNRIARDLHDSVKQQVFGLAMQIGAAQKLFDKDVVTSKLRLDEAKKLVRQVQHELVNLIEELRPAPVDGTTFNERLAEYVSDWSRQHSIPANVNVEPLPVLPHRTANTFFRITQEALANIARHSRASEVTIRLSLERSGGTLKLSVVDDGCGFETHQVEQGLGLQNIRERAASLPGGWCSIESQVGGGSAVIVECRLEKKLEDKKGVSTDGKNEE